MITFGLTGGIASGKSTVTKTFRTHNIPMVDADIIAREVVVVGSRGLELITEWFGLFYLNNDGTVNRTKLAALAFSDKSAMQILNRIMMPRIQEESARQIAKLHAEGHEIVGYDAALIVEMGNQDLYRPLIVVSCPRDTQIARLTARNGLTQEEAVARIDAQMTLEQKVAVANFVIDTSGTTENSISQTEEIIKHLHKLNNND